jgi:hypothetical protein
MKKQAIAVFTFITMALAVFFIPAASGNTLDDLVQYVSAPVVRGLAQEAVEMYSPAIESISGYHTAEIRDFHTQNVLCRERVYDENRISGEAYDEIKEKIFQQVKAAASLPNMVRFFYDKNVGILLDEMKAYALSPEGEESQTANRLTIAQTKEMFFLYQKEMREISHYLAYALEKENSEKLRTLFQEVRSAEYDLETISKKFDELPFESVKKNATGYELYNARKNLLNLEQKILENSGPGMAILIKDKEHPAYLILWLERRRAISGDEIFRTYREIADDFAARLGNVANSL